MSTEPIVEGWPEFPPGVTAHASVDLGAYDPAALDSGKRQCVACRSDGERCRGVAITELLICALHAGRLDSAAGGRARAEKQRKAKEKAEEALARRSLGTRAMIAHVLHEREEDVAKVVNGLIDQAKAGDMKAQSLLLPYINQALGLPTERVEHTTPTTPDEVDRASTETLQDMVARARARRAGQSAPDESTG